MNNTADSPVLQLLDELFTTQGERPPIRNRFRPKRHAPIAPPPECEMQILEQSLEDLLAPGIEPEERTLTWEEREAAGTAELLRIYQEALHRPLPDAEYARSEQIVDTLNAHKPVPST